MNSIDIVQLLQVLALTAGIIIFFLFTAFFAVIQIKKAKSFLVEKGKSYGKLENKK